MSVWPIVLGGLIQITISVWLWKLAKRIQSDFLKTKIRPQVKNTQLNKEKQIKQLNAAQKKLKREKSVAEAKLYNKLKAAEEKKKNLAK